MAHRNIGAMREVVPPEADRNRRKNRVYTDGVIDAFHCRNVDCGVCVAFEPLLRES